MDKGSYNLPFFIGSIAPTRHVPTKIHFDDDNADWNVSVKPLCYISATFTELPQFLCYIGPITVFLKSWKPKSLLMCWPVWYHVGNNEWIHDWTPNLSGVSFIFCLDSPSYVMYGWEVSDVPWYWLVKSIYEWDINEQRKQLPRFLRLIE